MKIIITFPVISRVYAKERKENLNLPAWVLYRGQLLLLLTAINSLYFLKLMVYFRRYNWLHSYFFFIFCNKVHSVETTQGRLHNMRQMLWWCMGTITVGYLLEQARIVLILLTIYSRKQLFVARTIQGDLTSHQWNMERVTEIHYNVTYLVLLVMVRTGGNEECSSSRHIQWSSE